MYDKLIKLMKKLYSSTFLSIIIAFLTLLGMQGEVEIMKNQAIPSFSNIIKPVPKIISEFDTEVEAEPIKLPIEIEVFYTFGCADCTGFNLNTVPALLEKYGEDENVDLKLYVVPNKENDEEYYSAVGLKCAAEYEKYWELHRELNLTTEPLSRREVDLLGQGLELPVTTFRNCLLSGKYDEEIDKAIYRANQKNVTKKPAILIGDYKLFGNQPIENIQKIINEIKNYKITKLQD